LREDGEKREGATKAGGHQASPGAMVAGEAQREEKVRHNPDLDLEKIYQWALEQVS